MTTIREVCDHLKTVAPLHLAEEWDNVGLLLGEENGQVQRILTCLTLTGNVADEAAKTGAGLVVTHHPVLFKAVKKITSANAEGRMLLTLLRHGIAVYSPHTAWDNASTGINQQLAELLGLTEIAPLRPRTTAEQVKIVTFVPEPQLDQVRQALWAAGAGTIGDYHHCSFNSHGVGTFFGSDSTKPAIGQPGQLESVDEIRLEVICASKNVDKALASLRKAHPYEEPAVDVFAVKALTDEGTGSGRYGTFAEPISLSELNQLVAHKLRQPVVQFTGDPARKIKRLGIACGAAAEFLKDAHRAGCQALLTGEARFHACLEAEDLGIEMILPGHYATERFAMEVLAERLSMQFPNVEVQSSLSERDPVGFLPRTQ